MEQIENIPLAAIMPHPGNRYVGGFDKRKLKQLAESIKAMGVQQPAVVRRRTEGRKGYELVAGERRWRASKIAGLDTLPCVVREIDDFTLMKIQTVENLQREDVHPLDEADGFKRLMDKGGMSVDMIAKEVGQTKSYIYHRLKLCSIESVVRKALMEEKISTGHAELIARLPGHYQQEALTLCFANTWIGTGQAQILLPLKDVRKAIDARLLLELGAASFDKEDADLLPSAGPCATCPKRTLNAPELFSELKGRDYCTDQRCYEAKIDAGVERKRQELKEAGEEFAEVSCFGIHGLDSVPEGAINPNYWEECGADEPGAEKALVVAGAEKGKVVFAKIDRESAKEDEAAAAGDGVDYNLRYAIDQAKSEIKQSRDRAITQRLFDMIDAWYREHLESWEPSSEELVIIAKQYYREIWAEHQKKLCALYGWEFEGSGAGEYEKKLPTLNWKDLALFLIRCTTVTAVSPYMSDESKEVLDGFLDIIGLSKDEVVTEIKAEYAVKLKKRKAVLRKKHKKESAA